MKTDNPQIFDYVVIGSGFGGSVSAMRLAEKGYSVLVLEKGKRYAAKDFPKSDWKVQKFLWAPIARCFGFQKLTFFKEVFVLSGVGVGGGSIVYGNTHMTPGKPFFNNPSWNKFNLDWQKTLSPFYELAKFMLGTVPNTKIHEEDHILQEVAKDMGKEDSFGGVNVGVYFGDTNKEKDPYFNGLGPKRKGCIECAGCMVGCRHNAKNTLDKNYLWFAEKFGAKVQAETMATQISYQDGEYQIETMHPTKWFNKKGNTIRAKGLVVAGGVLGTMKLLLQQKFEFQSMPKLSNKLGASIRTNSESICAVTEVDRKLNNGVAISSYFNPDDDTHIEIVKYNNESGALGKIASFATKEGNGAQRTAHLLGQIVSKPFSFTKMLFNNRWGKNTIIFLVMQSLENSMKMVWKKGLFGGKLAFSNKGQNRVPAFIKIGQEVMERYAKKVKGTPQNALTETVLNMATTAHILGGCPMGKNSGEGVINERFEVHGYPNMYVLDGSIIQGNLGVNPSLTITAISEYAMSLVPQKPGNLQKTLTEMLSEKELVV